MAIDYDEKQNTTNQPTSWQNNSTSYVYPDAYGQNGPGGTNKPPKKPRSAARTLGIVALVLSITVLFSALTGASTCSPDKPRRRPPDDRVAQTTRRQRRKHQRGRGSVTIRNSAGDAASRHVEVKKSCRSWRSPPGQTAVVADHNRMTATDMFGQIYSGRRRFRLYISKDGYIVTNKPCHEGAENESESF